MEKTNQDLSKENDESHKSEGLPETAEMKEKKKALVLCGFLIILIIFSICTYRHLRNSSNELPKIEDNYSPDVQIQVTDNKNTTQDKIPTVDSDDKSKANKELTQEQIALLEQKKLEIQKRISAPMVVVNNTGMLNSKSSEIPLEGSESNDPNTQFLNKTSTEVSDTVNATRINDLDDTITEGSLIHASLETAVDSDLPGYLRAVVSDNVYSADGSQVLIPHGSRLIGKYKSGMLQGQSRVFVVWTRVITPDGISVNLGSEGVDNLGIAGIGADDIDHHFFQQFGIAGLISIIGAGTANVGVNSNDQYNSSQAYRIALANSFSQTASQSLNQMGVIAPTLHINQGKDIMVFVAHDLNFKSSVKSNNSKILVF